MPIGLPNLPSLTLNRHDRTEKIRTSEGTPLARLYLTHISCDCAQSGGRPPHKQWGTTNWHHNSQAAAISIDCQLPLGSTASDNGLPSID